MDSEANKFPTRSYPYRYRAAPGEAGAEADASADAIKNMKLEAGRIYRFVLGIDPKPQALTTQDAELLLGDPFAKLLLRRGKSPLTLRDLLSQLDAVNSEPEGLPDQTSFLVADGGQIPWTPETTQVGRLLRVTITRARANDAKLMISASTEIDSAVQFLQLIAWDSVNNVFNFYERRGSNWFWAGNSYHALLPDSRGQGPFDSHVNGSMVMKELRAPWNNWHSMNAHITKDVLAPDNPFRNEPLFLDRTPAHELELGVVRPGIDRWNRARLTKARSASQGNIADVRFFLRHVFDSTTINLVSSDQESRQINDASTLVLPTTFFLNTEAFLDHIGLEPEIRPVSLGGRLYKESLRKYEFRITDGDFSQMGDTFFAFLVPEPALKMSACWDS